MNEKWGMEKMGSFIKDKHVCSLSRIKRFKSPVSIENNYRVGRSLRAKPDRPDSRFYPSSRSSRRPYTVAIRNLASYKANSTISLEGVQSPGGGANIGYVS